MASENPETWVAGNEDGEVEIVCSRRECLRPNGYWFAEGVEPYRAQPEDIRLAMAKHIGTHTEGGA